MEQGQPICVQTLRKNGSLSPSSHQLKTTSQEGVGPRESSAYPSMPEC